VAVPQENHNPKGKQVDACPKVGGHFLRILIASKYIKMLGDVDVQDASTIVTYDEEAVEHAECDRWGGEEIHGRNGFPMVSKENQPAPGSVRIPRRPFHPTGNGSLGKIKAEHEELAMDVRGAPSWVLNDHLEDQLADFLRRLFPSDLPLDSGN